LNGLYLLEGRCRRFAPSQQSRERASERSTTLGKSIRFGFTGSLLALVVSYFQQSRAEASIHQHLMFHPLPFNWSGVGWMDGLAKKRAAVFAILRY
jgi:hypothetical protein